MQGFRATPAIYVVAGLTVLTTILFAAATAVERREAPQRATAEEKPAATAEENPADVAEGSEARESQERMSAGSEQKVAGLDLEAPWVLYAVVIETVVLAVALVLLGYPVLFVVILVAIAGAILDVRELQHQIAASRGLLAVLVAIVVLTRAATVTISVGVLVNRRRLSS